MAATELCAERLEHLTEIIREDVAKGLYYGAVLHVARHGETGLHVAVGSADKAGTRPLDTGSVFSIFSITKAFINVLALRAIELGRFALTTRVVELIPEFKGAPRDRATFFHLLTHTTGMPGVWEPRPGMFIDRLDELVEAVCAHVHGAVEPGTRCDYSPIANHVLLAEAVRRTDPAGRDITRILDEDLFRPLGMRDTSMGLRRDLRARHVVPDMRGTIPIKVQGRDTPGDYGLFEQEHVEAPHVGCVSTAADMGRFAAMLRGEGTLGDARLLSRRMVQLARRNWTGEMHNELYRVVALRAGYEPPPAYLGFGFNVRGTRIVHHQLGTLTSPETFGNYGAGSAVYWIDPELDMTFVGLTAGVMTQAANIERFQRLSDIAVSAAL